MQSRLKIPYFILSGFMAFIIMAVPLSTAHAQQGTIYFRSGFESGNVSEWTAGNRGKHEGGGYVSTERPRTGRYSWKAYNNPSLPGIMRISAKLLRWSFDYRQAYYSAWYYWPTDYRVTGSGNQYVNFFQWKERQRPFDPTWIVAARGGPSGDQIVVHDWHARRIHNSGIPLPKGRWFHVEAFLRSGRSDGQLIVWLDGREIYRFNNINTLGNRSNPSFLMWGVGNYGEAGLRRHVYVDDIVVASYRIGTGSVPNTGNTPQRENNNSDAERNQGEFSLDRNFPNPFNPVTTINYTIPENLHVVLKVYNPLGQEVKTLVNQNQPAGRHSAVWDATDNDNQKVTSGIYLYRLEAGEHTATRRMILLK